MTIAAARVACFIGFFGLLAAASAPAGVINVNMQDFLFSPAEITIEPQTVVRWTNLEFIDHTVTSQTSPGSLVPSGLFDSGNMAFGDVFEFRFTQPGDYSYFCIPHGSSMQGMVRVTPEPSSLALLILAALAARRSAR